MSKKHRIAYIIYKLPPKTTGAGLRILRYFDKKEIVKYIPFILTKSGQVKKFIDYQTKILNFGFKKSIFKSIVVPYALIGNNKIAKYIFYPFIHLFVFIQLFPFLLAKYRKYDIIHSIGCSFITYNSILISKILKKSVIIEVTILDEPPIFQTKTKTIKKLVKYYEQYLYKLADEYIVLSMALYNQLVSMGIREDKITTVQNPVNTNIFFKPTCVEKTQFRKEIQVDKYYPVFIFIGSLVHRKGADIFPDLLKQIIINYPNSYFLFLGENNVTIENRNYKKRILDSLNYHNNQIRFVGKVNDVSIFLKSSDIFLFPSRREGLPNAVLEAMATGLPVLMNNIPGISDFVISNGINGYIIKDNDVDLYMDNIRTIMSDKKQFENMSYEAIKLIRERFTIDERDKKIDNLYNKLLNQNNKTI